MQPFKSSSGEAFKKMKKEKQRNMKTFLTSLLTLSLILTLTVPALAADGSRGYDFDLSVNGEHEIQASPGDILTVTLTLRRTDSDTADLMYAMQDEIYYDDSFFEIIDSGILVKDGANTTNIALHSGGRALYVNFLSLSVDEYWESETLIGSFRVKVLGTSGVSTLKNMNYLVSLADGSGGYTSDAQDVTVVVSADCTVRFETNGGSEVADQTVRRGDKATKPADPIREGYAFQGWYGNPNNTEPWDFYADTVTEHLTLYAGWTTASATDTGGGKQGNHGFKWWIPVILILSVLLMLTALLYFRKKKAVNLVSTQESEPVRRRKKENK